MGELLALTVDHTGGGVARYDTTKQIPNGISRSQSSRYQALEREQAHRPPDAASVE